MLKEMDEIIEDILREIQTPTSTMSETALKQYLYREMVRLSLIVDDQVSERQISAKMSALVRKAKTAVTAENNEEKVAQLLHFLYQTQGFVCHYDAYFATDSILMHKLLADRKGMPISMAAIVLYLASKLELPLYAVNFPTQLILRAEFVQENGRHETRFINPWNGEYLTMLQLEKWLEGETHFGANVTPDLLKRAEPADLLERVEALFKMTLTKERKYEETLRLIEYRLTFSPEDPYEIRDRGMILASMDCYQAAYEDLSYFVDQCPDDPTAHILKNEMVGLERKSKENALH